MSLNNDYRNKLIQILSESPFINYACRKVGITRATFYRWMKSNIAFRQEVERALKEGHEQSNEVAGVALTKKVRTGDMGAIKFYLTHNDPRYLPKRAMDIKLTEQAVGICTMPDHVHLTDKQKMDIIEAKRRFGLIPPI